ncbi:MAG TPA: hypothetical protein VN684_04535 [Terriglobales bacterium]|nr:hypothetical protein [Terriglobales bacterium]
MHLRPVLPLTLLFLVSLGTSSALFAQSQEGVPKLPDIIRNSPDHMNIPVTTDDQAQREQAIRAAQMRQEEIKRETQKLFELSAQLKEQMDKGNGQVLSVDALKKTEEIEKLAHKLKGKMKSAY